MPDQIVHAAPARLEKRIEEIEVLRALAVSMVVAEHMPINLLFWHSGMQDIINTWWSGGPGVDLFFAISGFLILRGLLPRLMPAHGHDFLAETLTFYLHRFWRLQPSAWLWLLIPIVLAATFNETNAFHAVKPNVASAVTAILAINNLRLGQIFGTDTGVTFPYWSLSLEEQFYLLAPLAVFVLRRRIVWLFVAMVIGQFFMPAGLFYAFIRPGAFGVGGLLALWSERRSYAMAEPVFLGRSAAGRFCFVAIILLILGTLNSSLIKPLDNVGWGMVAVLSGILVYAASFSRGYICKPGLLRQVFLWVGSRSYAIYLVHMPAFCLTQELYHRLQPPIWVATTVLAIKFVVIALVLIILLAELTYRFVEKPARRYGRTLRIVPPHASIATC